jgi:hypothetical protein
VIRFPSYYRPRFTDAELSTIERHTANTARRFGYPASSEPEVQHSSDQAPRTTPAPR